MNSLTFVSGVLGIITVTKGIVAVNKIMRTGNDPKDLVIKQRETKRYEDFIRFLAFIQIVSCIAYSVVYIIVLKRAFNKFEAEYKPEKNEEDLVANVETMVLAKCIFVIVFYIVGFGIALFMISRFSKNQKKYEDFILGNQSVPDTSSMDISHHKGTNVV